jgi:hypothetical protein
MEMMKHITKVLNTECCLSSPLLSSPLLSIWKGDNKPNVVLTERPDYISIFPIDVLEITSSLKDSRTVGGRYHFRINKSGSLLLRVATEQILPICLIPIDVSFCNLFAK